jgi:hypothetical protein
LDITGVITPSEGDDFLIGMSQQKMYPKYTERGPSKTLLSYMVFDGLIDEVKIYDRALSAGEISKHYVSNKPEKFQPLQYRKLPSGPKGPGRFGGCYCRLNYVPEWERFWRVGPHPDILVRFDESPVKLIFWRGTNYGACWLTENEIWMADQSVERCGTKFGCSEHMSDKQARFSYVRIVENNDARVGIHWRYACVDIRYEITGVDPDTGWGDWTDEYYYIYPDQVMTRHQILYAPHLRHEWQETIFFNQPGTRPEDNVQMEALTLANMKGEHYTYSWENGPPDFDKVENANIQLTNLKADNKHFLIVEPGGRIKSFKGCVRRQWSHFPWWNHWPVAQIPNDGRRVSGIDRPSHSSLSQSQEDSEALIHTEDGRHISVSLVGMTDKPVTELVLLARSWLNPPEIINTGTDYISEGFNKFQKAYVFNCQNNSSVLKFTLNAGKDSPVVNPAFVIKNWSDKDAALTIDGKSIKRGRDFRFGHRHKLEGTDLIVWIREKSSRPVDIALKPLN